MSLRDLTASTELEIGACASLENLENDRFTELLGNEFNRLALENDLIWKVVHPERETFAFKRVDKLVDFAERHEMAITGHALVWHIENPNWLVKEDWRAVELADVLRSHIHTITERYADCIDTWDVVNEAVDDTGELRETFWLEHLGENYIDDAFYWASEHTDADLYYNDYGLPYNEAKQDRVYDLLKDLLDHGIPVDGIGIQMHCVGVHPTPEQIQASIHRFQELGLDVRVTELDVAYHNDKRPNELKTAQAAYYQQTVSACLEAGVEGITVWGVTDDQSWITSWREYPDTYTQQPLLFDDEGRKSNRMRLWHQYSANTEMRDQLLFRIYSISSS
ncbi:endo-1,4-beta-xylanase [Haladaptatus caseinilyticus]|uniref:endo-1,4-beta-xylanase n=1 Tax=Haladaptatus caseinilyticus TaxID=2993314 RepID=UPI00224B60AF|nr:endo-1,4-beta-xylanase [Haladaptatus caseinilyticus]